MKSLKAISFSIFIDSDREKIWRVLWDPENEQMVFAHQKELKAGVETESMWQGAKET